MMQIRPSHPIRQLGKSWDNCPSPLHDGFDLKVQVPRASVYDVVLWWSIWLALQNIQREEYLNSLEVDYADFQ